MILGAVAPRGARALRARVRRLTAPLAAVSRVTLQKQSTVYIANLTAMTVGSDPNGAACPDAWVKDSTMPYPNPPAGPCSDVHPGNLCVASVCVGTAQLDGGAVACSERDDTETNCVGDPGCTWHESCPKTLTQGCESGSCTAEHCITLSSPGTCTPAHTDDAQDCGAVTELADDTACLATATQTGAPCVYAGEDWRCYLHFTTSDAQVLKGPGPEFDTRSLPLMRCPLVSIPVVGEQYVFGITDKCGWRQGDFVALSEVPEAFLPMLNGEETCPVVNTEGGGSVMLVIMLIVVFPIGCVVLYALAVKFGPKSMFGKGEDNGEAKDGTESGGDANPTAKGPAAP